MKRILIATLKILGTISLFLLAGAYLAFSTMLVSEKQKQLVCQNINVIIIDSSATQLVLKEDVYAILQKREKNPLGQKIIKVDLHKIEEIMKEEQCINRCEVYSTINGMLTIKIAQQSPILRLETKRGSFYMDNTGALFPTIPQRTAYVPVVSGNIPIENREWIAHLFRFGTFIHQHRFWSAQIEQLYIHDINHIEIVQRAGTKTTVMLGSFERFETKLQKLYTFYQTITSTLGWNRYSSIDLRFQNQIVCKK